MQSISSELPFNPALVTQNPTIDEYRVLLEALTQQYHYLAEGGQSFAFASNDGRFVIKFLKQAQRRPPLIARLKLPEPLRRSAIRKGQKLKIKQTKEMLSYKIASDRLKKESALIAAHLNKTSNLSATLYVIDKKKKGHSIDLDKVEFLVQYRLTPVKEQITTFMQQGNEALACTLIDNITALVKTCHERGLYDDDARLHKNIGCIGSDVFLLDTGRLRIEEVSPQKLFTKLKALNKNFDSWLTSSYPSLAQRHQNNIETWLVSKPHRPL